ncbi:agamous-like MADS-box protein AGL80 [Carex littledalei]|uniref:Agamous-like MADS-box protein AGL80 n=1 Tax=Carex littledalei TaxID=544730 RepID=A0A833RB35_9POAL|nr:agamous-like MADS-box protein AGL80 [Carex littledalei]
MARNKVKLQYISNDALRRATLKKRLPGLLKKVQELHVLCGVDACGIIYSPGEAAPQVWPQPQDARRILRTFNSLPEVERTRKMTNHLAFMQERVGKLRDKVGKRASDDPKLEVSVIVNEGYLGSDFAEVSEYGLWAAGYALDDLITKVFGRMCTVSLAPIGGTGMGGVAAGPVAAPAAVAPVVPTAPAFAEAGPSTQATRSGEGSGFSVEEMGDFGCSSDDTEDDSDDE